VGDDFRFSVKLPKAISHARASAYQDADVERFADEVAGLGEKLGAVLVQFPPSRAYRREDAETLFQALGLRLPCPLVCEPRHATWFAPSVERLLDDLQISRVGADPPPAPGADVPGGSPSIRYHRLHGSPLIYYSEYTPVALDSLHSTLDTEARAVTDIWCIFDNTAAGAATSNALELVARLCRRDWQR
jgi:uncharacterized protein YecE (DUF72 family)